MKLIRALRIDDDATAIAYFLITLLVAAGMLAMLPDTGAIKLAGSCMAGKTAGRRFRFADPVLICQVGKARL